MQPPACLLPKVRRYWLFFFFFWLVLLKFLQLDMNLNMVSVFQCALKDLWFFYTMTFLGYDHVLFSAHTTLVRCFIPCHQARSAPAQLKRRVSFIHPMLFSCFSCFFPLSQWGRWEEGRGRLHGPHQGPLSCPPCTLGAWTAGADFRALFFFLWLLLFVPARLFWFISCFGPGLGSAAPAPRRPLECGAGCPQHAPAVLENSLPFELPSFTP